MAIGKEKLRKMLLFQKYITFCLERELGVEPVPDCLERELGVETVPEERMLKWFAFNHLNDELQAVSCKFYEIACSLCAMVEPGPERTVALRKLLEAKDAAVRAKLNPGG